MDERRGVIREVLIDTYGPTMMTAALVDSLDEGWDDLEARSRKHGDDFDRELTNAIWMWFGGGGTASGAARRILERLGKETD